MEKTAVILMGLQGSGKSSFYAAYLAESHVHISLDELKTRKREAALLKECVAAGRSFAVDNTNPLREDRARYILPAKAAGYRVEGYFMESKLQRCIERNEQRQGKARIPAAAIAATSNKLQLPGFAEGFDALYFVRLSGEEMIVEKWREEDGI